MTTNSILLAARFLVLQGVGPYSSTIKKLENDILDEMKKVQDLIGKQELLLSCAPG